MENPINKKKRIFFKPPHDQRPGLQALLLSLARNSRRKMASLELSCTALRADAGKALAAAWCCRAGGARISASFEEANHGIRVFFVPEFMGFYGVLWCTMLFSIDFTWFDGVLLQAFMWPDGMIYIIRR